MQIIPVHQVGLAFVFHESQVGGLFFTVDVGLGNVWFGVVGCLFGFLELFVVLVDVVLNLGLDDGQWRDQVLIGPVDLVLEEVMNERIGGVFGRDFRVDELQIFELIIQIFDKLESVIWC